MMKRIMMIGLCLLLTVGMTAGKKLELKDVTSRDFNASTMFALKALPDGDNFARISEDQKRVEQYSFKTGKQVGVLFDVNDVKEPALGSIDGFTISPDGKRILIQTGTERIYRHSFTATFYLYSVSDHRMVPLSKNGPQQTPLFSPDGQQVAFVRGNNIFLVSQLDHPQEQQITSDGKRNEVINGIPDWVNEEEFGNDRMMVFTADGSHVVWVRYDEAAVKQYSMPLFKGLKPEKKEFADYPGFYTYKYPIAGEQNAMVTVWSYDITSQKTQQLQVPLDKDGYIWICSSHHSFPALLRLNPTTEKISRYTKFTNQDGTSYTLNYVRCAAQDLQGNIWMGSDQGLFMYTSEQIADPTAGFTQIKVPRNDGTDYADYLMSGVNITCIAVDGGNRKWIGTDGNGIYLISADNMEQIHHFTTENSKLLSDIIESIAINHSNGEVFIGTDQGLCSYFSDATTAKNDMSDDDVYAYPNPVSPDYTGLITVVGLSFNADVKILSSNGKLIAEGRSNGGSFTWDGCDKDGKRVASGIYFVAAAKEDGTKGTVCKIAIIK